MALGLLGTGAQDGHLDFHTAPEHWSGRGGPSARFDSSYVRAVKLSPSQKRERPTERKVKRSWPGTLTMHSVTLVSEFLHFSKRLSNHKKKAFLSQLGTLNTVLLAAGIYSW